MNATREFGIKELILIGMLSGIAVSLVKLVQAGFHLGPAIAATEFHAALLTYAAYVFLGAFGAVFLVDHDARGQKMLKGAFLMGFVAPSFFLALLNNPVSPGTNLQEMLNKVPKIAEFVLGTAHAQDATKDNSVEHPRMQEVKVQILYKTKVEPSFWAALQHAVGWNVTPASYTYVVGTTSNAGKATAIAADINQMLVSTNDKGKQFAKVWQPIGKSDYYITVGDLDSPAKASAWSDFAKDMAIKNIGDAKTDDAKRAAALILKGQVIDARAMFSTKKD